MRRHSSLLLKLVGPKPPAKSKREVDMLHLSWTILMAFLPA